MFSRRSEEPLNGNWTDDALAKVVEQALDVAPAPDFVARVRTRVAAEHPAPALAWSGWRFGFGAAALAAACVAGAFTWAGRGDDEAPVANRAVAFEDRRLAPVPAAAAAAGVDREDASAGAGPLVARRVRPSLAARGDASGVPAGLTADNPAITHFPAFSVEELQLPGVVIATDERRALRMLLNPAIREPSARAEAVPDEIVIPDLPPLVDVDVPGIEVAAPMQIAALEGDEP